MAPALNEPLSPTEKLTKSTVSVTTVPVTRSTRRQSLLGGAPTLKAASTPIGGVGSHTSNTPEKTTTTIITRRRTRSKESSTLKLSLNNKNSKTTTTESMGLNDALGTTTAQSSSTKENKNNNSKSEGTESVKTTIITTTTPTPTPPPIIADSPTSSTTPTADTTQEILANLTINFEEAISAEICLRKQLLDSNLNKEAVKKTNGTEIKDILVIKGGDSSVVAATDSRTEAEQQLQHMEQVRESSSVLTLDKLLSPKNGKENASEENECKTNVNEKTDKKDKEHVSEENNIEEKEEEKEEEDVQAEERNVEEEDTLEARLSQLDGSLCETSETKSTTTTITIVNEHDLQDLHAQLQLSPVKSTSDELKELQMQLQLSPSKTTQDDLKELQAQLQFSPVKSNATQQVDLQDLQVQLQLSPTAAAKSGMTTMQMLVDEQHNQESTNIPQIVSNTGDIEEEDLEEVIRALKGFDPATAGPDTLCDLNAIFGEVYQNMNYEDVNTTQTAAISPIKSNPIQDAHLEIDEEQQTIQRRLEFLIRRLRKLQARHMCKHTSEELAGIFEYTVRTVNNTLSSSSLLGVDNNSLNTKPVYISVISARPSPEVWQEERETPVPVTQVQNLMRKIETTAKAQQLCTLSSSSARNNSSNPVRKSRKSSAALDPTQPATPIEPPATTLTDSIIPTLDALAVEEITQVTGLLQAEMREVQQSIDSEATESSSGCESADEMISYNNHVQQQLPIEKRAAWRYARDRAAIAARWSWLMSHIADIDIKIRQYKELYNEIVRNKGPVIDDVYNVCAAQEEDNDRGSCRTRGSLSSQFRKRKLLQTPNIHTISKKAARPSTIKCGCQWPMQPCALCTGRSDPTAPRELPNTMVKHERVALLDSGFHPVLSLPEDVSSSLYSEAVARLSDWQQRAMRCQVKTIAKGVWKAEREATVGANKKHDGSIVKRRYIKKKDRLAAEAAAVNATASRPKEGMQSMGAVTESGSNPLAEKNGIESATSTAPLVANRRIKQNYLIRKRITTTKESMEVDSHYQTMSSEYTTQKYENYNNNRINQTLNSHKNNNNRYHRNRKAFSSSSSSSSFSTTTASQRQNQLINPLLSKNNNHMNQLHQHHQQIQQYHNTNGNSSSSETAQQHNNNNLHLHDNWDYVTSMRSRTASPTHAQSNNYRSERKKSSYDIDNIVIPYSVAAATRVEIIPYKEIATPKWRVIGSDDEECDESCEDSEEKQRSVINAECDEQDTTKTNIELSFKKTEDSKDEAEKSMANETVKLEENVEKNVISLMVKEEEIKIEQSTTAMEVEEKDLQNEDNKVTVEKKEKEEPLVEITESLENEVKSIEKIESHEEMETAECGDVTKENKEDTKQTESMNLEKNVRKEDTTTDTLENDAKHVAMDEQMKNVENSNVNREEEMVKAMTKNEVESSQFREKLDISLEDGDEETSEDITDAVMALRHERGLIEERRKFQTYLKFPWTTRSRANRRGDSRAESSGANTPDPISPAPNPSHLVGGEQESIPSPATTLALSAPTTPFTPMDSATPDALHEPFATFDSRKPRNINNRKRCRTTSSKKDQERRSPSPDNREINLPYEPLKFPLNDGDFEEMQCLMPNERRPHVKKQCNKRKPIGRYGRGRNGLRRQGNNISSTLIRSVRPRLSNKPYVMNTKENIHANGMLDGLEQTSAVTIEEKKLHLGETHYGIGDSAEETEDETETCGLNDIALAPKDDVYTEEDDDLDEDEDDGFPRNPLATTDNLLVPTANVEDLPKAPCNSDVVDSAYAAYVGHDDMFSDGESSDTEPFKDDDPNDPEWNGEPRRSRT